MTAQEIAGRLLVGELTRPRIKKAKALADTGPQRGPRGKNYVLWGDVLACLSDEIQKQIEKLDA